MARYRLTIAYDGTRFHGWQRQSVPAAFLKEHGSRAVALSEPNAAGRVELRTAQAVLISAATGLLRTPTDVLGASRTDAGVHAHAQTAAFTCPDDHPRPPDDRLADALNSRLPEDIAVRACVRTHDTFDPISDCLGKRYRYRVWTSPARPLWTRAFVHQVHERLTPAAMLPVAAELVGEHDFAAFAKAGHGRETTVRTVHAVEVVAHKDELLLDVQGAGFLHNMVRIIAGTLVEAGRGRIDSARVQRALHTGDRRLAGPTLPPRGLTLLSMRYPGDTPAP